MIKQIHVLYIDDNPFDRDLVRDALTATGDGFLVTEISTRGELEAALVNNVYNCVLSDLNILGYTGLDVFDIVKKLRPELPVVILTGTGSEELAVESMKRGVSDYILKTPRHIIRLPYSLASVVESTRLTLERRADEEKLRIAGTVFQASREGIMVTDPEVRLTMVNPSFTHITGYSFEEVRGRNPSLLRSERHSADFFRSMWASLSRDGYWQGEIWNRRKDGTEWPSWLSITVVRDENGEVRHYAGVLTDMTERWEASERLKFLAYHDHLTGLSNRTHLEEHIATSIKKYGRAEGYSGLLFIDIDNFKSINSTYGHIFGDHLLKRVAHRLIECVSPADNVCRLGGDEFMIYTVDRPSIDHIADIAKLVLERLALPYEIHGQTLQASASIGIAVYPDDGYDSEVLIRNVDAAMSHAKEAGRNTFRFFNHQMKTGTESYLYLRHSLLKALENGEFILYYQPQINLLDNNIIGVEALIRWKHPVHGIIPPGRFIPAAEDNGLIVPIGEWVIHEACRQLSAWKKSGISKMVVAVNLSALQFRRGDLEQTVATVLRDVQLDASCLELELTESIMIKNIDNVLDIVKRLKTLGLMLSIDDFGTGYSSLAYLKRFKVDKLKIDQSFIRDLTSDPEDAAIVRTIIQMAHSLNLRTIAEGVEDAPTLEHLRRLGCDEIQGYYIAKPMPADAFVDFAAAYGRKISDARVPTPTDHSDPVGPVH